MQHKGIHPGPHASCEFPGGTRRVPACVRAAVLLKASSEVAFLQYQRHCQGKMWGEAPSTCSQSG